jgi:cytochrome c
MGIKIAVLCAVVIGGMSLVHPFGNLRSTEGGAILNGAHIDQATLGIIQRSCQNCHSERTEWPWYSRVAPGSWLLERDVSQARSRINLSRWKEYSPEQQAAILSTIGVAARTGVMPPSRYTLLHPDARLSSEERQQIYTWSKAERRLLR